MSTFKYVILAFVKGILGDLKLLLSLTVLSCLLLILDNLKILNFPKSLLQNLTVPIQYGLYQSGSNLGKQFNFLFSLRTAAQENKALKIQLGELLLENAGLKKKFNESEILIDQYSKISPQTFDLLPSRVISSGRYLTIDKGSLDGVKIGQALIFKDNFVGEIKVTTPKTSQVILPQDPDYKIAVFSQGNGGKARGVVYGQFNSEMLMDKILHQEEVVKDDLIYSEGSEGRLPRGLIVGRVAEVFERQNEVFKQAKVEPIFELSDLDIVFIVLD